MKRIADAVSVVLMVQDRLFAIKRQLKLKAFPGYWAFPGGKVDADDAQLAPAHDLVKGKAPRLMGALVREIREELGLDLKQAMDQGRVLAVEELGLAVTPDFNPQRFATHFFKVTLAERPELTPDSGEILESGWFTGDALQRRYEEGELLCVPPVLQVIKALALDPKTHAVPSLGLTYDAAHEVPMIESLSGVRQLMPLSHTLPPATRTNCFLIGDQGARKIMIDPSPQDEAELAKLLHVANRYGIDAILLTHHHGDHHEFAPQIAHRYKLPILLSEDTRQRLTRANPEYLLGLEVRTLKEGDAITTWLGHPVKVVEVPGHDEGQLALAPENMAWFLAGDLFQGIGTVVIGGDEGDMAKYMRTLAKVIALKPRVVYPSHGIGLGGTGILEKTLEHRKLREQQVLELTQKGRGEKEILDELYSDIPLALHKYALMNIQSHLRKLKEEGAL